jgi:hypothetical protein
MLLMLLMLLLCGRQFLEKPDLLGSNKCPLAKVRACKAILLRTKRTQCGRVGPSVDPLDVLCFGS